MPENTATVTRKRIKRTFAERLADYGKLTLQRIAKACIPSDDLIAEIEKANAELETTIKLCESLPASHKAFGENAIKLSQFRVNALREKMGNPSNISEVDALILKGAARIILKSGRYNLVSLATFVSENAEIFPVKGTKF